LAPLRRGFSFNLNAASLYGVAAAERAEHTWPHFAAEKAFVKGGNVALLRI
jgi:hypothetical protein